MMNGGGGAFGERRGFEVERGHVDVEVNGEVEGKGMKKKQEEQKVPFLKLFAFADLWDYVLMAVGTVGAVAHGASVPVFFIFFGKLINIIGVAFFYPAAVSDKVAKVVKREGP